MSTTRQQWIHQDHRQLHSKKDGPGFATVTNRIPLETMEANLTLQIQDFLKTYIRIHIYVRSIYNINNFYITLGSVRTTLCDDSARVRRPSWFPRASKFQELYIVDAEGRVDDIPRRNNSFASSFISVSEVIDGRSLFMMAART